VGKSNAELEGEISKISAGSKTSLYDSIAYLVPIAKSEQAGIVVLSDGDDSSSKIDISQLLATLEAANVSISFWSELIDPRFLSSAEIISQTSGGYMLKTILDSQTDANLLDEPKKNSLAIKDRSEVPLALAISVGLFIYLTGLRLVNRSERNRMVSQSKALIKQVADSEKDTNNSNFILLRLSRKLSDMFNLNGYLFTGLQKVFFTLFIFGLWLLIYAAVRSLYLSTVISIVASMLALRSKVKRDENSRILEFEKELPGALKMLAGSLSAGLSFLQALSAYAEDSQGQTAREFRRALAEIQLGIPMERALDSVATRMKSEDLRWAVSAITIQREVGGSLASILNSTAETIESRFELRREVRTLSAEGRISSYILMALPIGIFIFLSFLRPDYIGVFIAEPAGNLLLLAIFIALTTAWFWLKSLVRISV
jgi:Flp pilus assembly protein TadB